MATNLVVGIAKTSKIFWLCGHVSRLICKFKLTQSLTVNYGLHAGCKRFVGPTYVGTTQKSMGLYTAEQRVRRDESVWTLVQGILAPLQFVVFIFSAAAVGYYLATDAGYSWASWSVVVKTMILYLIMVTGAVWEKVVFGQYLFAPAFFWEDVFSFAVIGLHTLYLYGMFFADFGRQDLMLVAIIAYVAYVINAGQFLWKLRVARLEGAGA